MRTLPSLLRAAGVVLAVALGVSVLPVTIGTAASAEPPLLRIERIADGLADRVGFDWRAHGVTFHVGCSELHADRCPPGAYETGTRRILIAEASLRDAAYLEELVLHELAHAWQFTVRGWPAAEDDLRAWGRTGVDGLEAAADCLAAAWGATRTHYWQCPPDAVEHLRALFAVSR